MLTLSIIMVTTAMPLKSFTYVTWGRLAVLILVGSALIGQEALPIISGQELIGYPLSLFGFNGLLQVNPIVSLIILLLIITAALLVSPVCVDLSCSRHTALTEGKEFFIFSLCTVLGAIFLASCTDSLTLLLGLELQSYSVYVIAAQYKGYEPSEAAGLKYYLLGALSSAIVFMGLGILYVNTASTNFKFIAELASSSLQTELLGYIFIFTGFTWKIAAAPLHNWSVDVYDAVPSKSASWLSLVPKIAIITLIQVFAIDFSALSGAGTDLVILLMITSVLSLTTGSVAGLTQPRIKRLLAYSGILNVGFILLSIGLSSSLGNLSESPVFNEIWLLYLGQYILTTAGIWLCLLAYAAEIRAPLTIASQRSSKISVNSSWPERTGSAMPQDITTTTELQGMSLAHNGRTANLMLATTLTLLLFSAAGIPPLVGFFAKYQVIGLALTSGFFYVSLLTILASLISSVYYLRVIRAIWAFTHFVNTKGCERTTAALSDKQTYSNGLANTGTTHSIFPSSLEPFRRSPALVNPLFTDINISQVAPSTNKAIDGRTFECFASTGWFAFSLSLITGLVIIYCFQIPVIETWLALRWY